MFIGPKQIKETKPLGKTSNGIEVVEVVYEDNTSETLSKLMYDKIISETACDASQLRNKRMYPIVILVATVLRDWGLKTSELPYFGTLLNQSLDVNIKEAERTLWLKYIPTLTNIDDVDLIAVDLVLRDKLNEPVPSPYGTSKE